ncbi:MAG: hypothetical protein NVS3B26_29890 [Mycobacteriales bacterium]
MKPFDQIASIGSVRILDVPAVHATANVLALGSQALSLNDRLRGRLRRAQWVGLVGTRTLAAGGRLGGPPRTSSDGGRKCDLT